MDIIYRVSFVGHRDTYDLNKIEKTLSTIIEDLLKRNLYVDFMVGRNGDFDIAVASIIKRTLRNSDYNNGTIALVLPYKVKDEIYYKNYYDEIVYPVARKTHFKRAITERNTWMVDNSELLICYVEKERGGARDMLEYAKRKGVEVINLAEVQEEDEH